MSLIAKVAYKLDPVHGPRYLYFAGKFLSQIETIADIARLCRTEDGSLNQEQWVLSMSRFLAAYVRNPKVQQSTRYNNWGEVDISITTERNLICFEEIQLQQVHEECVADQLYQKSMYQMAIFSPLTGKKIWPYRAAINYIDA